MTHDDLDAGERSLDSLLGVYNREFERLREQIKRVTAARDEVRTVKAAQRSRPSASSASDRLRAVGYEDRELDGSRVEKSAPPKCPHDPDPTHDSASCTARLREEASKSAIAKAMSSPVRSMPGDPAPMIITKRR